LKKLEDGLKRIYLPILVAVAILWSLFPIYQLVLVSFTPSGELLTQLFEIPKHLTAKFFKSVLFGNDLPWPNMYNSVVVATLVTVITVTLSVLGGYSFSRWKSSTSKALFYTILVFRMFPPIITVIPIFLVMQKFALVDTFWGLVLAHIPFNLPLAIWLMKAFYDSVPIELEEAAWIDGASISQELRKIVLPLVAPGIGVTAIFMFLDSYIEFLFALTLSRRMVVTMPVKIAGYVIFNDLRYQVMFATVLVSTIPVVILYFLVRKRLLAGLSLSFIKG